MLLKDFSPDEIQKVIDKIEAIPLGTSQRIVQKIHPNIF